jgi:POT family proton-dependent oligopeptide transporter
MMGAWFLFSAFGEIIAGRLGTWAAIEPDAKGQYDVPAALSLYADVFTQMMWIGVIAGGVLFLATPLLKRLTRE